VTPAHTRVRGTPRRLDAGLEFVLRYAQEWQVEDGADAGSKYLLRGTDVYQADPSVSGEQLIHYRFSAMSVSYVYTEHPHGGRRIVCRRPRRSPRTATECGCSGS